MRQSLLVLSLHVADGGQLLQQFVDALGRGDMDGLLASFNVSERGSHHHWPGSEQALDLAHSLRTVAASLAPQILEPCLGERKSFRGLKDVLDEGNFHLREHSQHILSTLHEAGMVGAPGVATLRALVAAVAGRTHSEGSMAPDCRMLEASINEGGSCNLILNVGLMCIWSLLQAAERCENLWNWAFPGFPAEWTQSWQFRTDLGDKPAETLEALLTLHSENLSMAEIGVFKGDLSTQLLERFPHLRMLLVDPYHLRMEGWRCWVNPAAKLARLPVIFAH
ncbi:unnamed protein product [Durusdinium trenchii]|uniref:O-methyltransferase domain-containing protein n=1 Tax=Durusdinium trenchii TaxID=1381693 RepID=A0ABP0LJR6_9DINO